jgi:hypothetical protein
VLDTDPAIIISSLVTAARALIGRDGSAMADQSLDGNIVEFPLPDRPVAEGESNNRNPFVISRLPRLVCKSERYRSFSRPSMWFMDNTAKQRF